tara:strand:- start:291 stop:575 length:285 start_codon:yes stop_codon:yes gene_type:complete
MDTVKRELNQLTTAFDLQEVLKRAVKYLVEGGAVAVAAYYIPKKKMEIEEIIMIAITAAATFALLDMFAPSISGAARQGAGFGIGANLVGFPKM